MPCAVTFGDLTLSGGLEWKGAVRNTARTFGRGDDAEVLEFSSVSIKGAGKLEADDAPEPGDEPD